MCVPWSCRPKCLQCGFDMQKQSSERWRDSQLTRTNHWPQIPVSPHVSNTSFFLRKKINKQKITSSKNRQHLHAVARIAQVSTANKHQGHWTRIWFIFEISWILRKSQFLNLEQWPWCWFLIINIPLLLFPSSAAREWNEMENKQGNLQYFNTPAGASQRISGSLFLDM